MSHSTENATATQSRELSAGAKIVVVDDDPIFCELMHATLVDQGASEVECFLDGKQALAYLRESHGCVDVISLDLKMPKCDGQEVVRGLADFGYRGRLIMISGEPASVRSSARELAITLGLDCPFVLAKPTDWFEAASLLMLSAQPPA